MDIRREDKQAIRSLALIGASVGACIGILVVLDMMKDARRELQAEQQVLLENEPLLRLKGAEFDETQFEESRSAFERAVREVSLQRSEVTRLESGFWVTLPLWGVIGLCSAAALFGMAASYTAVWIFSWVGSIVMYKFIRLLYMPYWKLSSDKPVQVPDEDDPESTHYLRDKSRILPVVIKVTVLLLIGLTILAVTIYHLAGI